MSEIPEGFQRIYVRGVEVVVNNTTAASMLANPASGATVTLPSAPLHSSTKKEAAK